MPATNTINLAKPQTNYTIMKKLLEDERTFFQLPREGDLVEGPIIAKEGSAVYIDLGQAGVGVIYGREYYDAQSELKNKNVGDIISAKIIDFENENGLRELSLSAAGKENNWQKLTRLKDSRESIEVKILAANRGGLIVEKDGVEGFLPASQLSPNNYPRVEGGDKEKILKELQKFIGKPINVRVLDVDQSQNKFIVSEKAGEEETIRKALEKYHIGDVVEGEVTGVVDFGAFVRIDPFAEGLIHISELDWELIENPRNVINVGDKVNAKIIDISPDGRIALSIKSLKEDPWKAAAEIYKVGDLIKGIVLRLNSYGTFVKVAEGVRGLVHVSEFESFENMRAKLEEQKEYEFEITQVNPAERRMMLRLPSNPQPIDNIASKQ